MKKEEIDFSNPDELVKVGALNVLCLGYKGIKLWREKRDPIPVKNKKQDEKKA